MRSATFLLITLAVALIVIAAVTSSPLFMGAAFVAAAVATGIGVASGVSRHRSM